MKALKIIGIVLLCAVALGLFALVLLPGFMLMDMFLGMEPVIICIAIIILGLVLGFIIKNPIIQKLCTYLLGSTLVGVLVFYILGGPKSEMPIWIVLLITAAIILGIFLTSVLKNIPFIGDKAIPVMWFILIIVTYMIIALNVMPAQ